jgi:hypothetical protein
MESYSEKFKRRLKIINGEDIKEDSPKVVYKRKFNIHKRSLPVGLDVVVVYNIESKEDAEQMIVNAKSVDGKRLFSTKIHTDSKGVDTVFYYEPIPVDATPEELSVYYNFVKPIQAV